MKFTAASILALVASASAVALPRQSTRTVVFTNEQSGRGVAADIPTTGVDVLLTNAYPALFEGKFLINSVMITSGVVEGALCHVFGTSSTGAYVDLASVNGRQNYARIPQNVDVVPETIAINCV